MNFQPIRAACERLETAARVTPPAEKFLYDPVDDLLNIVSGEVVNFVQSQPKDRIKFAFGQEGTVIWYRASDSVMAGGFPKVGASRPNHRSFLARPGPQEFTLTPAQTLRVQTADEEGEVLQPSWQETLSIGVSETDEMDQHEAYTINHSKFRIDYPIVRGFIVDRDGDVARLRLTGMNARGFWSSPVQPIDGAEAWVTHVCEVYEAHARRITNIEPLKKKGQVFHRFTIGSESMIVAPVFAKPPPSRKTFVGFRLNTPGDTQPSKKHAEIAMAYRSLPATGLFKLAWHDSAQSPCHEITIYEAAHRGSWNPGLARHQSSSRLDGFAVKDFDFAGTIDVDTTLVPEYLTLASIGEPLSACRTPRELFEVIYDACLSMSL